MDTKLKIGFIGYTDITNSYLRAFEKLEDSVSFEGLFLGSNEAAPEDYDGRIYTSAPELFNAVDAVVFFGEKIRKKLISDAIRSLKHIFIDDYSAILNNDIDGLYNLVTEAEVTAQVSMPKMYYWSIPELMEEYKGIRYLQFIKEQTHLHNHTEADYIPELAAIIKVANEDVLRTHYYGVPLLNKKVELVDIRLEFANGVSAGVNVNPCGFYDAQELRIISEKAITMLDLRKREWYSLRKNANKDIEKEVDNMEEFPFIEQTELEDFISSIISKKEPVVSFRHIRQVKRCLTLMEESR